MSAFTPFAAQIVRLVRGRTPTGAKTTAGGNPIPGSPFPGCRVYVPQKSQFHGREEQAQGVVSLQNLVLSIPNPNAAVKIGDIAVLPEGLVPGVDRARIQRVRPYQSGVQCDLEAGAVAEGKD